MKFASNDRKRIEWFICLQSVLFTVELLHQHQLLIYGELTYYRQVTYVCQKIIQLDFIVPVGDDIMEGRGFYSFNKSDVALDALIVSTHLFSFSPLFYVFS